MSLVIGLHKSDKIETDVGRTLRYISTRNLVAGSCFPRDRTLLFIRNIDWKTKYSFKSRSYVYWSCKINQETLIWNLAHKQTNSSTFESPPKKRCHITQLVCRVGGAEKRWCGASRSHSQTKLLSSQLPVVRPVYADRQLKLKRNDWKCPGLVNIYQEHMVNE